MIQWNHLRAHYLVIFSINHYFDKSFFFHVSLMSYIRYQKIILQRCTYCTYLKSKWVGVHKYGPIFRSLSKVFGTCLCPILTTMSRIRNQPVTVADLSKHTVFCVQSSHSCLSSKVKKNK